MTEQKLVAILKTALSDTSRDLRDFVHQEISASEKRIIQEVDKRVEKRLDERIGESDSRILSAIAESVDTFLTPTINNHERRLVRLEKRLAA